ncbi:MAG: hypothetical protein R3D05_08840 [Dongiaceae bacterium]
MKISRYLSPQIYKSIFSGQKDVVVQTERKRLTIFSSDIGDFTATMERLQPEALTEMLNEHSTEMSSIAPGTAARSTSSSAMRSWCSSATRTPAARRRTPRPACAWRWIR